MHSIRHFNVLASLPLSLALSSKHGSFIGNLLASASNSDSESIKLKMSIMHTVFLILTGSYCFYYLFIMRVRFAIT